jgi:DNA-binding transcriptional regulator YiaG
MPLMRADEYKEYTPREVRVKLAEVEMSRQEFASYVGITPKHLSEWLHNRANLSTTALIRMAEVVEALEEGSK